MEIKIEDLADFELTTPEVQALMKILKKIKDKQKEVNMKPFKDLIGTQPKKPGLFSKLFKKKR
jgi:hypothetical protein